MTEREIQEAILRICKVAGHNSDINMDGFLFFCNKLKRLGAEAERKNFCAALRQMHDAYSLASDPSGLKVRGAHDL
jgi:hypothetical protein